MNKCPTCKGSGSVYCTVNDLTKKPPTKTGVELPCYQCDGAGEVSDEKLAEIKEQERFMKESMCQCGEEHTFGSYPQDGECNCGIYKHHVHCGTCGKVSQIG